MKYIAWVALAFTLQFSVSVQAASREECLPIEPIAEDIMLARQSNMSMSDIMYRYRDNEAAQFLIIKAFDNHTSARNERVQQEIIGKFKNYAFLQCIKGKIVMN